MKTHTTIPSADVDPFGCAEMACRLILSAIMVGFAVSVSGCKMPQTVNFAPLVNLDVKDSANGNTVPVSTVP